MLRHGDERVADIGGGFGSGDLELRSRRLGRRHEFRRTALLRHTERGRKRQPEHECKGHQGPELEPVPRTYRHRQSRFCKRVYRRLFLLVVIHDLVVGVDDVVLLLGRGLRRTRSGRRLRAGAAGAAGAALRGIERRAGSGVRLLQLIQCPGDLVRVPRAEGLLRPLDRLVEPGLERGVELLDPFLRVLLYLVHHRVEAVTPLDLLAPPLVLGGVRLCILDHLIDVFVTEPGGGLNPDLLLLARRLVFGGDVQDPVCIDVERHLDLRHAPRGRRNPGQLELADRAVVERHLALALQHMDLDRRLVVFRGREDLRLLGRDRRVPLNENGRVPPRGSIPRDSGVTSSRRTSFTSPASTPPLIAAPIATPSSGFTPLRGSHAIGSLDRSTAWSRLHSATSHSMMRASKSSPPRCVSPLVDFTSNTPAASSRTEMSYVPPPRS